MNKGLHYLLAILLLCVGLQCHKKETKPEHATLRKHSDDAEAAKLIKAVSPEGLRYRLYSDPKWDGADKYPLVIWLHGSGESGDDNDRQVHGVPTLMVEIESQAKHPCVVLAPQCPNKKIGWSAEVAEKLMSLIADLVKRLPVDENRIYLTGMSMGGQGTWELAAQHPDVFACAVPLCGWGDPKMAESLQQMPIWAFHGDQDNLVPIEESRRLVAAVNAAGGHAKLTELKGEGHRIAGAVFGREEMLTWMFSQTKVPSAK